MADTMRTIAEIKALLATAPAGISAQDMRDVVESLRERGSELYISSSVETVISAVNTPVKMLGTTMLVTGGDGFSMPVNNRLQWDGDVPVRVAVVCGFSITAAANNKIMVAHLALNGSVIVSSEAPRKIGTGTDIGRANLVGQVVMNTGDYIEGWIENTTDSTNLTVDNMTMITTAHVI